MRTWLRCVIVLFVSVAVSPSYGASPSRKPNAARKMTVLSKEEAIALTREDAAKAYGDLSGFEVDATRQEADWHVVYTLKDKHAQGGGPEYVVDAHSGQIKSKRYWQ